MTQGYLTCRQRQDGTLYQVHEWKREKKVEISLEETVTSPCWHLICLEREDAEYQAWYGEDCLAACIVPVEFDRDDPETMTTSEFMQNYYLPVGGNLRDQPYLGKEVSRCVGKGHPDDFFARTFRVIGPAIPYQELHLYTDIPS